MALIREHLPLAVAPVPPRTPTERQRMELLVQLMAQKERLEKRVKDGEERIE